jgi:bifunctional oligoribonuclease and PAP phosphatase NrnA
MYSEADGIAKIISQARKILIIQADNPDADSLGSALALEHILGDQGKEVSMHCAVDVPTYLRYLHGWDRVEKELPAKFDASIVVDASTLTLFEKINSADRQRLSGKPCVVLDHHEVVENRLAFATVVINDYQRASTGELIYLLARQLKWELSTDAQLPLMASILGDTQGLSNSLTSAETYRIMAAMVEAGVDRPLLEEQRRKFGKMPLEIYQYKAALIRRTELAHQGTIASVTIPQHEINEFSPLYNPAPLIQADMLQISGVRLAIVFKHYADGKITGAIRSNADAPVAAELAKQFGGGGHSQASGFKIAGGQPFDQVKLDCLQSAAMLLDKLKDSHEAL